MTKQEAIELLDNLIGFIEDNQNNDYDEAFGMAIEALKTEIVRCRDCKNNPEDTWFECPMCGSRRRTDDTFCSFGERREK